MWPRRTLPFNNSPRADRYTNSEKKFGRRLVKSDSVRSRPLSPGGMQRVFVPPSAPKGRKWLCRIHPGWEWRAPRLAGPTVAISRKYRVPGEPAEAPIVVFYRAVETAFHGKSGYDIQSLLPIPESGGQVIRSADGWIACRPNTTSGRRSNRLRDRRVTGLDPGELAVRFPDRRIGEDHSREPGPCQSHRHAAFAPVIAKAFCVAATLQGCEIRSGIWNTVPQLLKNIFNTGLGVPKQHG